MQIEKLRTHLHKFGFDDIEILTHTVRGNPYKTPVSEAISQAVVAALIKSGASSRWSWA